MLKTTRANFQNIMFYEEHDVSTVESALVAFFKRVNDAYIASHTIHDLVNDSEYQRLQIKTGKARGVALGNKHLLPGYWFTVFVAPHEAFQRVLNLITTQSEENQQNWDQNVKHAFDAFKTKTLKHPLTELVSTFRKGMEKIITNISWLQENSKDSFPNKRPLLRIVASISSGNYDFSEESDLTCTFHDADTLCGYKFEAKLNVAEFNQLAIDFTKEMTAHLKDFSEHNKTMQKELSKLFIGEIFL